MAFKIAPFVALILTLWTSSAQAKAGPPQPDFAGKLPERIGEWKKPANPVIYEGNALYEYIDGAAELYKAFDFIRAITFEYAADKEDTIKVDIFDMGGARGAFGVFAHGRETLAAEVGQGSEYGGGLLTFWKDRWFVSVLGYPETPAKRAAVFNLGRAIAALIRNTGKPPSIVTLLPRMGLVPASIRTFHHHLLQNDYVTFSHENPLGIGPKTQAVLARYETPVGRHLLLVVEYPIEADAKVAEQSFGTTVLGGELLAKQGERWMGLKRDGKRIVVVFEAASKDRVNQVLTEVP